MLITIEAAHLLSYNGTCTLAMDGLHLFHLLEMCINVGPNHPLVHTMESENVTWRYFS